MGKKLIIWGLVILLVVVAPVMGWGIYQTHHYKGSEIDYSIEIDRERPLVWYYLTDAGYRQIWTPNLEALTAMGGIPYTVGEQTLITLVIDGVPYEYTEKVTSIDPPTYWELALQAVGFKGNITYNLRKLDNGGTRVEVVRKVRYQTLMAVMMEPFLERTQRRNLIEGLQKMKRLAESAPKSETDNPAFEHG